MRRARRIRQRLRPFKDEFGIVPLRRGFRRGVCAVGNRQRFAV